MTCARGRRSRRYLFYAGLLLGFCVLLAFAGCGTTSPIGELTAAESSINFGTVTVGHSGSATISLTNGGNGAVIVTQVEITGKPFRFMGSSRFPLSVPAGGTYSFPIAFEPSAAGAVSGTAMVVSNVTTGGLAKIALSGVGVQTESAPSTQSGALSGVSCSNSSITGAAAENCFVALNGPAGSEGVIVDLSSTNAAFKVPGTVTVPANATGAGFSATVSAVSTYESGELNASEGGISESFAYQLNAAVRILSSSAGALGFGSVTVNTSAEQSVFLTSTGTEPVIISSATLAGNGFSYSGPAVPVILNAGQELILNIEFEPATTGKWSGQLTIISNASSSALVIGLSGTGEAAGTGGGGGGGNPAAAPSSLSCASASLTGATTDSCTITLTSAATGSGTTVSLASSSSAVTVPGNVTVPAGAVSAGFSASASAVTAAQNATLTATANGSSASFAIQLNAAGAILTASPVSLAFGNVSLNSLATQTVTLTSAGTEPVTISAATLTGTGLTLTAGALPVTLNPGQSLTLNLGFLPITAGAVTGELTLTSNSTSSGTLVVSVTGTGAIAYSVNLAWAAPGSSTDPVAGYNIYRSSSGAATYQLLNSGVNSSTNYTDDTVESGQGYDYIVTSVDASGVESAPSNVFDVIIP